MCKLLFVIPFLLKPPLNAVITVLYIVALFSSVVTTFLLIEMSKAVFTELSVEFNFFLLT